ncbi:MAG: hypothetical protein JO069_13125 [Verrucomicrobia bacterium]|nr:hypothetical protein [Verrucomicrobiota bacterium]
MSYSLVHFLRHFPWKYYLSGGLFRFNQPTIAVMLGSKGAPALVTRGQDVLWYEDDLAAVPDGPPMPSPMPAGRDAAVSAGRSFSAKLLARCRLKSPPRYVLLPELSVNDFYCNVHRVASLRESEVESLLENLQEDPRQVLGAWDEPRDFRWAVLSTDLSLLTGNLDRHHAEVMIVGAPADYCDCVDAWIDRQEASLAAIIPSALACLRWFLEALAPPQEPCALLIEMVEVTVLAVLVKGQVVLVRQYANEADYAFEELNERVREFAISARRIYLWSLAGQGSPPPMPPMALGAVRVTPDVMREAFGGALTCRRPDGNNLNTEDPAAYLLRWASQHTS